MPHLLGSTCGRRLYDSVFFVFPTTPSFVRLPFVLVYSTISTTLLLAYNCVPLALAEYIWSLPTRTSGGLQVCDSDVNNTDDDPTRLADIRTQNTVWTTVCLYRLPRLSISRPRPTGQKCARDVTKRRISCYHSAGAPHAGERVQSRHVARLEYLVVLRSVDEAQNSTAWRIAPSWLSGSTCSKNKKEDTILRFSSLGYVGPPTARSPNALGTTIGCDRNTCEKYTMCRAAPASKLSHQSFRRRCQFQAQK